MLLFLYLLCVLVGPFPMWPALPTSEYYEPIRLPARLQTSSFVVGMSYRKATFCGACRVSQVLKRLSPCVPRPVTPTDSPHLAILRCYVVGFHAVDRVAVRFNAIRGCKWSSGGTNSLWPTWYSVYTSYNSFDASSPVWSIGNCSRAF